MDKLCLTNQICFPLYALSRQVTAQYQPLLEKIDLTYPQYLVMLLLWENELMSVKELGCKLMLDSGTLTPLLKRMEEKAIIRRSRRPSDERVVEITLTAAGEALKAKAMDIPDQLQCSLQMCDEEIIQLGQILQNTLEKIRNNSIEHKHKTT
jgi:DNA-binding MarR family transcriptional regulator